jgi:outer membrane protein
MRGAYLAAVAIGALVSGEVAQAAITLREALVKTYNGNPTITGQRAQLRTLDEGVAIARSRGRPQLSATVGLNQDLYNSVGVGGHTFTAGANVSYSLFNAGSVRNGIRAANRRVDAGRAFLRAVEGDIFTEAVAVYNDVIRDRSIVTLNRNQVRVLETNLQASRDRFEVGDLTRTDVAQSEARLSLARSALATAEGRLRGSEENFRRVIGELPDELEPPPPLPPLPQTADQAVDIALANNPDLIGANFQVAAAGLDVRVERAARMPNIAAVSGANYNNFLGTADDQFGGTGNSNSRTVATGGIRATIPIYQGGLVGARVRQAQAEQSQLLEQSIAVERSVVSQTRAAFAAYNAALEAIESNQVAVNANTLALEGTRAEQTVGTRNVLDVLNAEQELLNSQVLLVTARRDAYVAGFALLNAMGQAEADDLNLDAGSLYDPTVNYRRVARNGSDWKDDPAPQPVATRTVPPGATTPVTPPSE